MNSARKAMLCDLGAVDDSNDPCSGLTDGGGLPSGRYLVQFGCIVWVH